MAGSDNDQIITYVDANIDKLTAKFQKSIADLGTYKQKHQETADAIEQLWGKTNVGDAIGNIFSSARTSAIDEGAKSLGVFGGALEALGPAGVAAGVAIAALGIGMEQAKAAMEWSEELEVTARKLGVTTTALQEMDFAALQSGVSQDTLREGLQKVSQAIGSYQSNIKDARVKSIFEALGISKTDAREWQTPIDGMEAIADKIKDLGSESEKLALLKNLKVPDDMVPMMLAGGDALRGMASEAHNVGAIMDADMVSKAAELNKQLKTANDITSNQLREAFVSLAPAVLAIAQLMEKAAKAANDMAWAIGHTKADGSTDYTGAPDDVLERAAEGAKAKMKNSQAQASQMAVLRGPGYIDNNGKAYGSASGTMEQYNFNQAHQEWLAIGTAVNGNRARDKALNASTIQAPAVALAAEKGPHARKGPEDQAPAFNKQVEDEYETAVKASAEAQKALTTGIQARAKFETDAVDADTTKKLADLDAEAAKIKKSKNDADSASQLQTIAETRALILSTDAEKKKAIALAAATAIANQQLEQQQTLTSLQDRQLQAMADMQTTRKGRADIETQIFNDRQKVEMDLLKAKRDELARLVAAGDTSAQPALDNANQVIAATQKTQTAESQANAKKNQGPLGDYVDSLNDVNTALENVEVKGLQGLTSGITDAIMHTKSLGAAFHEIALSIITDLVQIGVQKMITQPLANMLFGNNGQTVAAGSNPSGGLLGSMFGKIFGLATGTDFAPGGLTMVGEKGPELLNVPQGSQVLPNNLLRNAMNAPGASNTAGGHTYNVYTNVQASDSVMTDTVQNWILQASTQAIITARQMASQDSSRQRRNSFIG